MLVRGTDGYWQYRRRAAARPRVDFGAVERAVRVDAVARFRASNAEQRSRYASPVR
jgi:hypothetical protein